MRSHPMLVTILAATLVPLAYMTPAQANVSRFQDSRTATPDYTNIYWVGVGNSHTVINKVQATIQIRAMPNYPTGEPKGLYTEIFIDTKPSYPGPEFKYVLSSDIALYRVSSRTDRGTYIASTCGGGSRRTPGYWAENRLWVARIHMEINEGVWATQERSA